MSIDDITKCLEHDPPSYLTLKLAFRTAAEALNRVTDDRIDVLAKEVLAREALSSIRETLVLKQQTKT